MKDFDNITTSVFGHPLIIRAMANVTMADAHTARTDINIAYRDNTYSFPTNGPIRHSVMLGSEENEFPADQIHAELQTIERLFLDYYGHKREPVQIIGDVLLAYRQLGPQLNIRPLKTTQNATDGNS